MSPTQQPAVTLIKLGGAVITDKSMPNTTRPDVLKRLVSEVKSAWVDMDEYLVVGHGAGSFAHVPAAHYGTIDGFKDEYSRLGMAIVQDSAAQLNRIVVHEFLEQDVPAVSACASSSAVTKNKQVQTYFTDVFEQYLKQGLLPVTYGDVIVDSEIGCTIWSTDTILAHCTREFLKREWKVSRIIHATQVAGVYRDLAHPELGMFDEITPDNAAEVKKSMGVTKGFDVTGGMWTKISESLELTQYGIETVILSGDTPGMLEKCLRGEAFVGTTIRG
jgi:isopentenyl phosphate kinase